MADSLPTITLAASMGGGCQAIIQHGPRKGLPCGSPTIDNYPYCHNHMEMIARPPARGGRYAHKLPAELRPDFEDMLGDADPKNLGPEIANIRTIVGHLLEQSSSIDEQGNLVVSKKDLEYVFAGIKLIGELTEKQAKMFPDKYVRVEIVMQIITDIIDIMRSSIPPDMVQIREKIAADIQRYCMNQVLNRAEETNGRDKPGNLQAPI